MDIGGARDLRSGGVTRGHTDRTTLLVAFHFGRDGRLVIYLDCFFSLSLSTSLPSPRVRHLLLVLLVLLASLLAVRHDDHQTMVKLSLISPKGNQGVRYFPYQGYLGLTPLRFEGRAYSSSPPFLPHYTLLIFVLKVVRTQIEQDGRPILAKDIIVVVRCYESRHGRLGTVQTNVLYEHSVTLWQKQDTQEWSEVGDSEYPFRFSIPSHIAAPSTALYFQEYRIFWRIEAGKHIIPYYLHLVLTRHQSLIIYPFQLSAAARLNTLSFR